MRGKLGTPGSAGSSMDRDSLGRSNHNILPFVHARIASKVNVFPYVGTSAVLLMNAFSGFIGRNSTGTGTYFLNSEVLDENYDWIDDMA
jgi:hypothetical protein